MPDDGNQKPMIHLMSGTFEAFVVLIISLAIALGLTTQAHAMKRGDNFLLTDPLTINNILGAIESSIWAKDGDGEKIVYVLYGTRCGWAYKFFENTRTVVSKGIQVRWIPRVGHGAEHVVSQRDAYAVETTFIRPIPPVSDHLFAQRALSYNNGVGVILAMAAQRNIPSPQIIYRTKDGLRVFSGKLDRLSRLHDEIVPSPEKAKQDSKALVFLQSSPATKSRTGDQFFANSTDKAIRVHILPDANTPVMLEITPQMGVRTTGVVDGTEWLEVIPYTEPSIVGYVHAPRRAMLEKLEYSVRHMTGTVSSVFKSRDVHSQPHREAPVLDQLKSGESMRKTGEVENGGEIWEEVLLYRDGTKGYLIK